MREEKFKAGDIVEYRFAGEPVNSMNGAIGILVSPMMGGSYPSWHVKVISHPANITEGWRDWLLDPFWDSSNLIKIGEVEGFVR